MVKDYKWQPDFFSFLCDIEGNSFLSGMPNCEDFCCLKIIILTVAEILYVKVENSTNCNYFEGNVEV